MENIENIGRGGWGKPQLHRLQNPYNAYPAPFLYYSSDSALGAKTRRVKAKGRETALTY